MFFELNENRDEEYYEVGDFVPNTQNTPVEKVPKNRRKQAKIYDRIETFTSKIEIHLNLKTNYFF